MIKLFRKLRQNSLSESNTKIYLLYAIGEIFLVVIGILIALQINNWNNDKIENRRNTKILENLQAELDLNIDRATFLAIGIEEGEIDGFAARFIIADSILELLDQDLLIENIEFVTEHDFYWYNDFNLNKSTYEQMKNTGAMYSIGSDSLINAIQLYYQLCEREALYNSTYSKDVIRLRDKCYNGWLDFVYLYNRDKKKAYENHKWLSDPRSTHYVNFRHYTHEVAQNSALMRNKLLGIVEHSKNLKNTIEKELASKK